MDFRNEPLKHREEFFRGLLVSAIPFNAETMIA